MPALPRVSRYPIVGENSVLTRIGTGITLPVKDRGADRCPLIGHFAPEIQLEDHLGRRCSLHATIQLGRPIVLFFFPLAGSPHCTKESCAFRDALALSPVFADLDAIVIGISQDDRERARRFVEEHRLGFRILSDVDRKVMDEWGVGTTLLGLINRRCTYIIDPQGIVRGMCEGTFNYKGHKRFAEAWLTRIEHETAGRARRKFNLSAPAEVTTEEDLVAMARATPSPFQRLRAQTQAQARAEARAAQRPFPSPLANGSSPLANASGVNLHNGSALALGAARRASVDAAPETSGSGANGGGEGSNDSGPAGPIRVVYAPPSGNGSAATEGGVGIGRAPRHGVGVAGHAQTHASAYPPRAASSGAAAAAAAVAAAAHRSRSRVGSNAERDRDREQQDTPPRPPSASGSRRGSNGATTSFLRSPSLKRRTDERQTSGGALVQTGHASQLPLTDAENAPDADDEPQAAAAAAAEAAAAAASAFSAIGSPVPSARPVPRVRSSSLGRAAAAKAARSAAAAAAAADMHPSRSHGASSPGAGANGYANGNGSSSNANSSGHGHGHATAATGSEDSDAPPLPPAYENVDDNADELAELEDTEAREREHEAEEYARSPDGLGSPFRRAQGGQSQGQGQGQVGAPPSGRISHQASSSTRSTPQTAPTTADEHSDADGAGGGGGAWREREREGTSPRWPHNAIWADSSTASLSTAETSAASPRSSSNGLPAQHGKAGATAAAASPVPAPAPAHAPPAQSMSPPPPPIPARSARRPSAAAMTASTSEGAGTLKSASSSSAGHVTANAHAHAHAHAQAQAQAPSPLSPTAAPVSHSLAPRAAAQRGSWSPVEKDRDLASEDAPIDAVAPDDAEEFISQDAEGAIDFLPPPPPAAATAAAAAAAAHQARLNAAATEATPAPPPVPPKDTMQPSTIGHPYAARSELVGSALQGVPEREAQQTGHPKEPLERWAARKDSFDAHGQSTEATDGEDGEHDRRPSHATSTSEGPRRRPSHRTSTARLSISSILSARNGLPSQKEIPSYDPPAAPAGADDARDASRISSQPPSLASANVSPSLPHVDWDTPNPFGTFSADDFDIVRRGSFDFEASRHETAEGAGRNVMYDLETFGSGNRAQT